jgi:hypothetical protein
MPNAFSSEPNVKTMASAARSLRRENRPMPERIGSVISSPAGRRLMMPTLSCGQACTQSRQKVQSDQIYPSNHGLYGIVDLFGWRNLADTKGGLELMPARKLKTSVVFHDLYLANYHDGLYNGVGNLVVRKADGSAGDHIGEELEGTGTYTFTKYINGGLGYGHLFPGQFIKSATKGSSYNISYLMLTYTF